MTAREPAILGIDLGTNEVKSGLVTLDGRLLASARAGYAMDLGREPGWAEQDPDAWWAAVTQTTRELAALDVADIVAVCADGHGPTLVAVDAAGHPTRPAITWLDTRAGSEADELAARTGVRGWALGGLPAALWVERHEPAVAAATAWYLTTWEYLALRLTDIAVAPLVANQLVPDPADVDAAGVPRSKLPPAGDRGRGHRRGEPRRRGGDRVACRYPGRGRDGRRLRELPRRRPARARRRVRPRWHGRRSRRVLGSPGRGARRIRDARAAARPVQRGRRHGRDGPCPGLVPHRDPRRHRDDRHAAARGRRHPCGRRRAGVPPVPRRRTFADLGSHGAWRARRPDARAPAGARRAGHRRGLGACAAPRCRAHAGGGHHDRRAAPLRRTRTQRRLEPGQGRRDRLPRRHPARARDGRGRLGDPRCGRHRQSSRTFERRSPQ